MKDIPIFKPVINESGLGFFAVSLVDKPATQVEFIAMNEIAMREIDEMKREIIAPLLIVDQLIYRRDPNTNEEFYILWDEQTIKEFAIDLICNKRYNNITIDHSDIKNLGDEERYISGLKLLKLWTTDEDNEMFNVPKGSLLVHYKIEDDTIWNDIINKRFNGLSIEAISKLTMI